MIGVDWGGARIGIAVGESEFGVTTARSNLVAAGSLKKDAEAIVALARKESASAAIVGLPQVSDDVDGKMARLCETLAQNIRDLGLEVYTVNEALTTVEAESGLASAGLKASRRRKLRDGESARLILERYFHEQGQT